MSLYIGFYSINISAYIPLLLQSLPLFLPLEFQRTLTRYLRFAIPVYSESRFIRRFAAISVS